jgi:arylformamidase
MAPQLIDVTVPIRSGMFVYAGNPGVHLEQASSIAAGATSNISRLDFGVHTGTHLDAPRHFIEDGGGAETIPIDVLNGPCVVVDATSLHDDIDAAALDRLSLPPEGTERVIFKTPNSKLWERDDFTRDFIRFLESGAQRMVDAGARLVGIDYLSVADGPGHRVFLGAGVVPLEGLDLREVEPGPYRLMCLALKIVGSDGAPARAVLARD